jgi:hypothetical protein
LPLVSVVDKLLTGALILAFVAVLVAQSSKTTDAVQSLTGAVASLVQKIMGPITPKPSVI